MSQFFNKFQGGIFITIKLNETCSFYYGENSWWLIDDWENDIVNNNYFETIEQFIIDFTELKSAYEKDCINPNNNICFDWLPSLYIDFDSKTLYNNFFDQALESRLIEGWEGTFIESKNDFLALIPEKYNYWDTII